MYRECIVIFRVNDCEEISRFPADSHYVWSHNDIFTVTKGKLQDPVRPYDTPPRSTDKDVFYGSFSNFYIKYV